MWTSSVTEPPVEDEKPPFITPRILAAPRIRQIYWCDFWKDARLPEMWKTRPAIVVSYKNTLHGPCLIVPTSTTPQDNNKWAYKLSMDIEGNGVQSWAICNQPSTVSPSRFTQFKKKIPVLPEHDFNEVLDRLVKWLPVPFSLEK